MTEERKISENTDIDLKIKKFIQDLKLEENNLSKIYENDILERRISFIDDFATIKYYGKLMHKGAEKSDPNLSFDWLGVIWDNNQRGKHNGTINDYTYFKCKNLL